MTRVQTQQALRQLPVKWAIALLGLIVLYALAQPALNSRLGWNLPSLARLMGEPEPKKTAADDKANDDKSPKSQPQKSQPLPDDGGPSSPKVSPPKSEPASKTDSQSTDKIADGKTPASKSTTAKQPPAAEPPAEAKAKANSGDSTLLYGILKETGRERYVSVEGLQYNPGSEEGHRLKHLERHLKDMPQRPGKHGVFDGEMKDALKWIDDAYARGKRGAKGVRKTQEDNRTIYEAPFTQPIGYIGGRDGKRDGNPPAKRLRLVVEGNKFITAFPF